MQSNADLFDGIILLFVGIIVHVFAEVLNAGWMLWLAAALYAWAGWKGLMAWETTK